VSSVDAPSAIAVTDLRKSFGEVEAMRGVSFEVGGGEVFGFLGPNGAGKTTTINILCTLARATGGSARVAGFDCGGGHRRAGWRRRMGPTGGVLDLRANNCP